MTPMERIERELQEARQRIAELERDCATHAAAEEAQIALRKKAEQREAALAVLVQEFKKKSQELHCRYPLSPWIQQHYESVMKMAASDALARRDNIKKVEAIEALALKAEVSDITAEACYDDHCGSPIVFEHDVSEAVAEWLRQQAEAEQ